jgi:molybdate transport system substrate-binding protein
MVATAANMQFSMEEIAAEFEKENDIEISIITGSSGKLSAQILEGAPFDIFVSADSYYPDEISKAGKNKGLPRIYAYGKLILLSVNPSFKADLNELESDAINHIAIANPKTAPYGIAAEQALNYFGLFDKVKKKLVFGESVAQSNQFLISGAAELALTSKSTLSLLDDSQFTDFIELDIKSYEAIAQSAVLINTRNQPDAEKFYLFLFSDKAKAILLKNGYDIQSEEVE